MDALARLISSLVDNVSLLEPEKERSVKTAIRGVVRTFRSEEENWTVVQAKRRREKEDVYLNHPGLDPVFMKI